ncbi:MAG: peptidylprolyl isomerase [Geminocystis sp.]|nr:peptidylprolyl isomerase [Geminocystis sp.]HIK38122.1 peptidylprolyl isomerase [Geminocystis sp. M7585_C2015_104]MCS7147409.1 peptidylprolyl isomerase [Geminocystis sp.]MCX8079355.1 peptidylprolyl isomerase [Geminocystis sp.]MDW8117098.1 peptidylprolyl isomerase [Geminocystis sp.]
MGPSLKVGDFVVTQANIFAVLAEKQMIAPLAREIIIDQAIASIPCTQEEIATAERQFFQQIGINPQDKQQIKTWLERNFLTREQLTERILRPLKLEKFKEQTWGQQVESYYLKRKSQLDRVVYSLIRTRNPGLAQELYFRLCEKEEDFAQLARQYSQGPEAQTGGLIGPVELSVPHPQLVQKLITAQPGQVLPPSRIADWIVILRLERYISVPLDENLRRKLLDELFSQWLDEQIKTVVQFNLPGFQVVV